MRKIFLTTAEKKYILQTLFALLLFVLQQLLIYNYQYLMAVN